MATEEYELRKKNKQLEKLQSNASWFDQMGQSGTILGRAARRKYNAAKADKQELDKATTLSMADKLTSPNPFATGGETSEKVPVVSFNENGNLVSKAVAQAVPVFVVGQADIRGKIA
jgi:alpha-L-fucosidase